MGKRSGRNKSVKAVAYKALAMAKSNAKLVETKRFDLPITPTTINYTPSAYSLIVTAEGDTSDADRTGTQITLTGVHLRMAIRSSTAATSQTFVRALVVVKKTPGAFAVTDYFASAGGAVNSYNSLKKWDNRFQFRTLYDRTFAVDGAAGIGGYGTTVVDKYIKIPKDIAEVVYDAAGNYEGNHPTLILVSNQNTATPTVHVNTRTTYKDA